MNGDSDIILDMGAIVKIYNNRYLVCRVDHLKYGMIHMKTGNYWNRPIDCQDHNHIPLSELCRESEYLEEFELVKLGRDR